MRHILTAVLVMISVFSFGQDKYNYIDFNKLTEVKGTSYVIASIDHMGKAYTTLGKYLLFINTATGENNPVEFRADAHLQGIEQFKADSLGINIIIMGAKTVDLNNAKGIEWDEPTQVIILSTDGKQRTQLTESKFFVSTWATNSQTGRMVVTGHYDTNNNGKYDKTDKNEIYVYDLKTLKQVAKL